MSQFKSLFIACLLLFTLHPATVLADDTLSLKWTLATGLDMPESVVYDAKNKRVYVSNVQGNPPEKDGAGYIAMVSLSGELLEKEWVKDGLNAPKGMAISGDMLYVSDVDALVAISISQAKVIKRYTAEGAKFLNDVTIDAHGNVYVSDMFTDTIHCLCDGQFTVWLHTSDLMGPNGLLAEKDRLIVGSWGIFTGEGFATSKAGHLQAINYQDKKVVSLGHDESVGNLDGVEPDGNTGYYVTDWMAGVLFHFDATGQAKKIMALKQGSADLTYLAEQHMLLIPMMLDNQVKAFVIE